MTSQSGAFVTKPKITGHRLSNRLREAVASDEGRSQTCAECDHPVEYHDGDPDFDPGCQFMYGSTAKGRGIGGSMMTACGCTAVTADANALKEDQ